MESDRSGGSNTIFHSALTASVIYETYEVGGPERLVREIKLELGIVLYLGYRVITGALSIGAFTALCGIGQS